MSHAQPQSLASLEADISARRDRLASTIDELTARAAPDAIIARQKGALKTRLVGTVTTPDGSLRVERIAAAAAVVVGLVGLRVWLGRRRG